MSGAAHAQTPNAPAAPAALERVPAPAPATPARAQVTFKGYDWTGFYVGGTIGYGGSLSDTGFTFLPNETDFDAMNTSLNPEPMGWSYGFHAGYNLVNGKWIYGVEGDYAWSTINGYVWRNPIQLADGSNFNGTFSVDQDLEWFSTVRARFGSMMMDKYYVYGTGGVAFGSINSFAEADFNPEGNVYYPAGENGTRTGWTFGGGIEGSLTTNLSWRAQYLYINFGSPEVTADPIPSNPPYQVRYDFKNVTNSFTFGVNFRF